MTRRFTRILAAFALLVFMAPSMVGWGQSSTSTITIDYSSVTDFPSGSNITYGAYHWESDDVGGTINCANGNQNGTSVLQFNYSESGTSNGRNAQHVANTVVVPGYITGITMTKASGTDRKWNAYVGTSALTSTNYSESGIHLGEKTVSSNGVTWTTDATNHYNYFYLNYTVGSASYISSIVITYEPSTGPVTPTCATPTFSPAAGTYTQAQNVSISCATEGATIYYTTNGDEPTTNSTVYTANINVSTNMTIKAMAAKADYNNSPVASATYTIVQPISGYAIDFEQEASLYTDWTFTNMESKQTGNSNVTAHGGTYYGTTGGKGTASITTKSIVAAPGILTCYVTKQTTNTTTSTWKIQVSENGSNWTDVATQDATTMDPGTWVEFTANLSSYTNVYVRLYYTGSTAVRNIDDLSLSMNTNPLITADDVNIAYDAEEGTINYTINNPVEGGSIVASCDAEWIEVDDTPQTDAEGSIDFICAPNSNFYAHSATVTLTYTYGDSKATVTKDITVTQALWPEANGSTSESPIMVSEAIDAIDEVSTVSNIYVGGIVSNIVTEYSSQYHNITFDMIDEEGNEYFLRAYRCGGNEAANVTVGDEVIVYGNLIKYGEIYEFDQGCEVVSLIHHVEPSITIANATVNVDAAEHEGTLELTYENLPITGMTDFNIQFYNANNEELNEEPDWIEVTVAKQDPEVGEGYVVSYFMLGNEGAEARTAYFKVYAMDDETNLVYSNLVTISQDIVPLFIGADPSTIEVGYQGNDNGGFEVLFDGRLQSPYGSSVVLCFYDENDNQINNPEWFQYQYIQDYHSFEYTISENTSTEPRTARMKIKYTDPYTTATIFSDYIPISQDAAPVLDYATLPFEFDSEYSFIANTSGLTESGVGNYSSSYPHLKFDGTGDWLILHFNEAPGMLSFTIKGNNFDGGTFSVQTSEDGATYSDLGTYNYFGTSGNDSYDEEFTNLGQNVRYIKWIYTEKVSGNVALGNIKLFKPITKEIIGGQWYLISSPVGNVTPTAVDNMTEDQTYGLFTFDQEGDAEGREWLNYKAGAFSQLQAGKGYLYINENGCALTFPGTAYSTPDGSATFPIDYYTSNPTTSFRGLNLVGNPFNEDAAINLPFYKMNATTGEIEAASGLVHPMEGVFVVASENVNSVTFQTGIGYGGGDEKFSLNLTQNRGNVIDRAIVRFDEGGQLPKVQLFENSTKIYISQNGKDYAVVRSEGQGELPVNFRASENGTYTLSMDVENMDMNYLHLIDNMTGMDVDLLQTPSYTFEAKVNDYESRFRLVFAANNEDGASTGSTTFAFYSNGSWIINNAGEATLQVVDLTGRILSSETVNGSVSKTLNAVPGIYMLRLINGDNVNVQKIVVR